MDNEKVSFYAEKIKKNLKVIHIADTHLFMDDDRGVPYHEFSNRMAKAYNQTTHFKTREKTTPMECFEKTLAYAKQVNADDFLRIDTANIYLEASDKIQAQASANSDLNLFLFLEEYYDPSR